MRINADTGILHRLLVNHIDKKQLTVWTDDFVLPKDQHSIHWTQVVRRLCDTVENDMKADLFSIITKNFSKATPVLQVVFGACRLGSVKQYYSYTIKLIYSIRQIALRGLVDDCQNLID